MTELESRLHRWLARRTPRDSRRALLGAGLLWAVFCFCLYALGYVTPAPHPFLAPEKLFLWQSLYVIPVLWMMWRTFAWVGHAISAPTDGPDSREQTRTAIGLAFALPLAGLFLVPDILAFLIRGFDNMLPAMAVYVPISLMVTWVLAASALRGVHGIGWPRALAAGLAGLVAAWLVGGVVLR
jgi:hypothetical protein